MDPVAVGRGDDVLEPLLPRRQHQLLELAVRGEEHLAAGASNATRPLMPRMVSPRWMPRPMPNGAASALEALDQRDRIASSAPSMRHGNAALEARAGGAPARAARSKAPRVSTQASSGSGSTVLVSVSRPPIVTPHRPRLTEYAAPLRRHGAGRAGSRKRPRSAREQRLVADRREDLELRAPACAARPRSAPGRCRPPVQPWATPALPSAGRRRAPPPAPGAPARRRRRADRCRRAHVAHRRGSAARRVEEGVARVHQDVLHARRALRERSSSAAAGCVVEAAGVDGHRDDFAAVGLAQPRHAEGGVEPAGEGEHDGPWLMRRLLASRLPTAPTGASAGASQRWRRRSCRPRPPYRRPPARRRGRAPEPLAGRRPPRW